jgi:hypothetical protein
MNVVNVMNVMNIANVVDTMKMKPFVMCITQGIFRGFAVSCTIMIPLAFSLKIYQYKLKKIITQINNKVNIKLSTEEKSDTKEKCDTEENCDTEKLSYMEKNEDAFINIQNSLKVITHYIIPGSMICGGIFARNLMTLNEYTKDVYLICGGRIMLYTNFLFPSVFFLMTKEIIKFDLRKNEFIRKKIRPLLNSRTSPMHSIISEDIIPMAQIAGAFNVGGILALLIFKNAKKY